MYTLRAANQDKSIALFWIKLIEKYQKSRLGITQHYIEHRSNMQELTLNQSVFAGIGQNESISSPQFKYTKKLNRPPLGHDPVCFMESIPNLSSTGFLVLFPSPDQIFT